MIQCAFENGNKASLRHVVIDSLIVQENKILLVKRALHLSNGGKWALVGGFVERNETLKEAVFRETLEETGYKVKVLYLFRIVDNPGRIGEDRQNITFIHVTHPLERIQKSDIETKEIRWFDLDTLPQPDEFAFDHLEHIELYKKYLKLKFPLPILGKSVY